MRFRLAAVACCSVSLLALAGCGGGSTHAAGSTGAPKGSSHAAQPAAGSLPTVSGSYGDKPTITFPKGKPPAQLEKKVLKDGTGPVVNKGDLLVADYLGQVWQGKVFDNSYDRKAPSAFQIGAGKVIPGWDEGLVGVKAGSRVLLVIPSDKGYGAQGQPQAGIPAGATLTFVVDVVESFGKDAKSADSATPQKLPAGTPKVTGAVGTQPTLTVPRGTKPPAKATTVLLDKGSGPAVTTGGTLVVQYEAIDWTGKPAGSTWQQGGVPVGVPLGQGTLFDSLVGVPVGSRVLLELPAQPANQASGTAASPAVAVAIDIVAEPGPAKSS